VVAYIDHVGRLEGSITRTSPTGFAMTISATPRKREKLAAQLTWLTNRHILGLPGDRRHERIELTNPRSTLKLPNGTSVTCRITDVSLSGAAIESETVPAVGALVTRPRGAWCGTSRAASPSSSPACSIRTSWKRT